MLYVLALEAPKTRREYNHKTIAFKAKMCGTLWLFVFAVYAETCAARTAGEILKYANACSVLPSDSG